MIVAILLTISLSFLLVIFEHSDLKWLIFIIMMLYGSQIVFSSVWALICFLLAKKSGESIAKIPDWRVEMVF